MGRESAKLFVETENPTTLCVSKGIRYTDIEKQQRYIHVSILLTRRG